MEFLLCLTKNLLYFRPKIIKLNPIYLGAVFIRLNELCNYHESSPPHHTSLEIFDKNLADKFQSKKYILTDKNPVWHGIGKQEKCSCLESPRSNLMSCTGCQNNPIYLNFHLQKSFESFEKNSADKL